MVGNMIRVLRARLTLLAVDEAGMSTVVDGSPAARSMTRCANYIASTASPASNLAKFAP